MPLAASNARVKDACKLSRRSARAERRLFLADGPKAVGGALAAGVVREVFATPAAAEAHGDLLAGAPVTLVDPRAMRGLSDSVSPAGVVALCDFLPDAAPWATAASLVVVCADVRDPGNAGTVIRTADAAAADAVVLAGSSVDPYNPKTVRASVGSLFQLPVSTAPAPLDALRAAQAAGFTVLAADGAGEVSLFDADPLLAGAKIAWLFGNEAWGLPAELAAAADHRIRIPILGRAESLNLATAAAVCLYATARLR